MKKLDCKKTKSAHTNEFEFAFISDIHGNTKVMQEIITKLKKTKIQAIILGGDIGSSTKSNLKSIIKKTLSLNIPTIIYPGSHENSSIYSECITECASPLLIDGLKDKHAVIRFNNMVEFFIIPGSDTCARGNKNYTGGNFWLVNEEKNKKTKTELDKKAKQITFAKTSAPIFLQSRIKKIIKQLKLHPTQRICLSHIPIKTKGIHGIDRARFGIITNQFSILNKHKKLASFRKNSLDKKETFEKNMIVPYEIALLLHKYNYPITIQEKNVGSPSIAKFLQEQKCSKLFCGHIHEAGPKAINKQHKLLAEKTKQKTAFINSGAATKGHITLATMQENGHILFSFEQIKKI